ncbi:acid phosphatase-domain-containing protein [Russula brevipes]|nr:acid phosphatase-domain-containing protein [Russula brevipes]
MSFPKLVALDTDWTIWERYLNSSKSPWGKGPGRVTPIQNNIERVDDQLLRDKTNHKNWIRLYDDISDIINDILSRGAQLAIASRNPSEAMCNKALYYFKATDSSDGNDRPISKLAAYKVIEDEFKVKHFKRIHGQSDIGYSDMVLFDDRPQHNCVRIELGVTFQLLRNEKGLTWKAYEQGIKAWQRAKEIRIVPNPSVRARREPRRVVIGYSGLATDWIERIQTGTGTVDTKEFYRWGYALYVGQSIKVARYYCNRLREEEKKKRKGAKDAYVCEIIVKDYDAWKKISKIWVPEHGSRLQMMDSKGASAFESGLNQENRDRDIAKLFGVEMPYVLFCRHHWSTKMQKKYGLRFTEMVVYTQIQRALFEVRKLSDKKVNRIAKDVPYPFHRQIKKWNITVAEKAKSESRKLDEPKVSKWLR